MKKTVIISSLVLLLSAGWTIAAQPQGQPFLSIESAISNLQEQINGIQLIPGPKGDPGQSSITTSEATITEANGIATQNTQAGIIKIPSEFVSGTSVIRLNNAHIKVNSNIITSILYSNESSNIPPQTSSIIIPQDGQAIILINKTFVLSFPPNLPPSFELHYMIINPSN